MSFNTNKQENMCKWGDANWQKNIRQFFQVGRKKEMALIKASLGEETKKHHISKLSLHPT